MEEKINPTPEAGHPEVPPVVEDLPAPQRKRSRKWLVLAGILVVFLAAAAFFGARLLRTPGSLQSLQEGKLGMVLNGGPGGARGISLHLNPAKELPTTQPTTNGLFVKRQDQSIFIGTGKVTMSAKAGPGGSDVSSNYDGPVVEVVITHATKVYQDITDMTPPGDQKSGDFTLQQVVKPGSLDDLGTNSMVTVWGQKQGDRFIADVIVFR